MIKKRLQDAATFLENQGAPSQDHVKTVRDAIRVITDYEFTQDHILYLTDQISQLAIDSHSSKGISK